MEGKGVSNGSYMRQMLFQLIHFLQGHILCFSVFQQTSDIKHVIQVSLDLHWQLITLCVLGFLWGNTGDLFLELKNIFCLTQLFNSISNKKGIYTLNILLAHLNTESF